jgi:hypothetical protein
MFLDKASWTFKALWQASGGSMYSIGIFRSVCKHSIHIKQRKKWVSQLLILYLKSVLRKGMWICTWKAFANVKCATNSISALLTPMKWGMWFLKHFIIIRNWSTCEFRTGKLNKRQNLYALIIYMKCATDKLHGIFTPALRWSSLEPSHIWICALVNEKCRELFNWHHKAIILWKEIHTRCTNVLMFGHQELALFTLASE